MPPSFLTFSKLGFLKYTLTFPNEALINATSVLIGSPPKDKAPIMLLQISENSIIRRRKMIAEEQLSEAFTKKLKTTDQMTTP